MQRERIRVLCLQPAASMGGAERQASILWPRLAAEGIDATVLVGPGRDVLPWFRSPGADVRWSPDFPAGGDFTFSRLADYVERLDRLAEACDALHAGLGFDLVIGSLGFGWALSGWLGRRWSVPAIWRSGGLSLGDGAERPRSSHAWALRRLVDGLRPALCLANSRAVADRWAALLGIPCVRVPNAVEPPGAPLPPRPGRGAETIVGFLGRLAPEKGLPSLLDAVRRAREARHDVRLRICGPGDRSGLQAEVASQGLSGAVELSGPVAAPRALLERCDVLALPSTSEGFPNVLLEAMAHGRACVATEVGGVPELVEHEVEALLVPAAAPVALASALVRLHVDRGLEHRLGAAGRARALDHAPDRIVPRVADVIRAVTARRAPGARRRPSPRTRA